jgi:hypothetical protein
MRQTGGVGAGELAFGGKDIDNDDYMCCEVNRLVQFPFVRNITEWKRKPNLIDFYND